MTKQVALLTHTLESQLAQKKATPTRNRGGFYYSSNTYLISHIQYSILFKRRATILSYAHSSSNLQSVYFQILNFLLTIRS